MKNKNRYQWTRKQENNYKQNMFTEIMNLIKPCQDCTEKQEKIQFTNVNTERWCIIILSTFA